MLMTIWLMQILMYVNQMFARKEVVERLYGAKKGRFD